MNYLQKLLISGHPLFITHDGFREAMCNEFPLNGASIKQREPESHLNKVLLELFHMSNVKESLLTEEYENAGIERGSIAYHPIFGFITSDCRWYFSSKQLEHDIIAAENNPQIGCHLLHINTPGGEAWYLDRLSETLRECKKPIIAFVEGSCCSAGYYIACHAQRIYACTANDYFGCIGTLVSFYDYEPYFEKLGIKKVEARATRSDLKNKETQDLRNGEAEEFIKDFLDPLNDQFINEVCACRDSLKKLKEDHPALRGKTYTTFPAIECGLIDDIRTLYQVVSECQTLSEQYISDIEMLNASYQII